MRRLMVGTFVAALLVAGCTISAPAPGPSTVSAPQPSSSADLNTLRVQYGLPECADTDPTAEPVPGGLPTTSLPCLGTDQLVNLADLPRVPTVLNLWAQWCAPCRQESPFLREAFQEVEGVSFVGINYQDPQPEWALEFAALAGWEYPHIQDMDRTLKADLKVPGLPVTLFVAADGGIAGRHVGGIESTEQLVDLIDQYLGEGG